MKQKIKIALLALVVAGVGAFILQAGSVGKQGANVGAVSKESPKKKVVTLSKSNTLVLNSEVNGESVGNVIAQVKALEPTGMMKYLPKSKEPLYLYLYTPGGEIQAGLELIEALNGLGRPVNTITSFAASMGFQIAQGLGERDILGSGVLMSHHAAGETGGQLGGKGKSQVNNRLGLWERRLLEMDELTVSRTNGKQTLESYQEAYDHELWLTGRESVNQGYADKVVTVKCDETLDGYTTHQVDFMGFLIDYDLSACPIGAVPVNIRPHIDTNKGRMTLQQFNEASGDFGSLCLTLLGTDKTKVCALDTSLNIEKVKNVQAKFLDRYLNIKNYVIPISVK